MNIVRTIAYLSVAMMMTACAPSSGSRGHDGTLADADTGPNVPSAFFPPSGMCRIWLADLPASHEPPVESCNGIGNRLPKGAYAIYGG